MKKLSMEPTSLKCPINKILRMTCISILVLVGLMFVQSCATGTHTIKRVTVESQLDVNRRWRIKESAEKQIEDIEKTLNSSEEVLNEAYERFDKRNIENKRRYARGDRGLLDEHMQTLRDDNEVMEGLEWEPIESVLSARFTPDTEPPLTFCHGLTNICDISLPNSEYDGLSVLLPIDQNATQSDEELRFFHITFETGESFSFPSYESNVRSAIMATGMFENVEVLNLYQ